MVLGILKKAFGIEGAHAAGPATKAGGGGGIEKIDIISNETGKRVELTGATAAILYYESILQDSIRATITFTDTGGSINNKTAMEGLPIVGQENVFIKLRDNNNATLKMTLYVNKVSNVIADSLESNYFL